MCGGRKRAVRTAIAFAATVSAMLCSASPAPAAFPGSNGKIAYTDSGTGIFRINPDGTNNELVKNGALRNAVWSSDGTKIAYIDGDAIKITAADGAGSTLVCDGCMGSFSTVMTWSPDATQFAFDRQVGSAFQIFRINADGTGETQLTTGSVSSRFPAWSPDGTKIAFIHPSSGVFVMNTDGTGEVGLGASASDFRPSWSPDGTKIAFDRSNAIWTMNANGTNQTQITTPPSGTDRDPAWSPDGQQIAFRGDGGLNIVNVDGTDRTTFAVASRQPDWQPVTPSYPRPKGATPLRVSLVPAFTPCASPGETHGPPLAFPSCNPPQRVSSFLTIGTPDANGQLSVSTGSMKADVLIGNPATQTDEADVLLALSITDVRAAGDLSDYTGELGARLALRRTDKENPPFGTTPATMVDRTLSFDATCTGTGGAEGATCSVQTSADALLPGTVQEGRRALWELGQVQVFDGGPDGDTATEDNTLFEVGGVFIP